MAIKRIRRLFVSVFFAILILPSAIFSAVTDAELLQKANFLTVIVETATVKAAVTACASSNNGDIENCNDGSNGIPAASTFASTRYFDSLTVEHGVITATSQAKFGEKEDTSYNFVLTPTVSDHVITWEASGTCVDAKLCETGDLLRAN